MSDAGDISLPLVSRRGVSLTARILAVNVFVLGLIASSLLYLDSYRSQLLGERLRQTSAEAEITALALARTQQDTAQGDTGQSSTATLSPATRDLMVHIGAARHQRLRLFDANGHLLADSFALDPHGPAFTLVDPAKDRFYIKAARILDRGMDALLGDPPVAPWREPPTGTEANASFWPEVAMAMRDTGSLPPAGTPMGIKTQAPDGTLRARYAPDRTPILTKAIRLPTAPANLILLTERNDRDITTKVRDTRQSIADVVGLALLVSIFLSLFLARTIVNPLRLLVRAAVRVQMGRERAVVVPRLPQRRDEIGLLARAFSDMTTALRQRIDAVESFAADVAHEIKNPLASLRSALDVLERVDDPDLRRQLTDIAAHDVQRIDRLITEIADASRIDAELSRTTFVPVDLLALAAALVGARERRAAHDQSTQHASHLSAHQASPQATMGNPPPGAATNPDLANPDLANPDPANPALPGAPPAPVRLHVRQDGLEPPIVPGDPARLERVLQNLLDNAVSFSPPGGVVDVVIATHGNRVRLAVCDDGPGIPADARERVFERFHSLRPEAEDFGRHSGLGLAIARTIIEAHNGTLTACDPLPPHRGARLVVDLPAWRR